MARINSNIPSLVAQSRLVRTNQELELRLERLSTGLRINRGSDDPAGLIISERIRSDIQGVSQGIRNGERASSVLATTEASLVEVNDLLNEIRALVVEAANSGANSKEERDANQLAIDSAVDSITRIANTSSFGGLRLLDGSRDYNLSGINSSAITLAKVNNVMFTNSAPVQVDVDVVSSAQTGAVYLNGNINPTPGLLASSVTIEVAGPSGVTVLSFTSGQTLQSLVQAVNDVAGLTGVRASLINDDPTSGVVFETTEYGSSNFVSITRLDTPTPSSLNNWQTFRYADGVPLEDNSPFDWADPNLLETNRDFGRDVVALVNGNLANGNGLSISVNSSSLGLQLLLDADFATQPDGGISRFDILGGGANFQLGPSITPSQQVNIGIPSVAASRLGAVQVNGRLAFLSSIKTGQGNSIQESLQRNDFSAISDIVAKAIDEVSILRGRIGAFERNVLDTNSRSLQAAFENLSASASQIRDADFAFETSQLTRAQILSSSGTTVLGLANQQSQQVLQLLG